MRRHPGFSLINITGLALGLVCVILILLWVRDELSHDRFHENSERIGRIIMNIDGTSLPAAPGPLAPTMIEEFPQVETAARYIWAGGILEYKDRKFEERNGLMVEPQFFDIFSFAFIKGDPQTALTDPRSIVLTESTARKLFSDQDPMGKSVVFSFRDEKPLTVTGIVKDVPHNSSITFNVLVPFELCKAWKDPDSWTSSQDYQTYVLAKENASITSVNNQLEKFYQEYFSAYRIKMFIQPLGRIHLHSHFKFDSGHGDIQYVMIFSVVAFMVLIIACINFMNLSTARFLDRAQEVGIRKAVGAGRFHLMGQFILESVLFTAISLALALLIVELVLPLFENITGKSLSIQWQQSQVWLGIVGILVITGATAGSYPAFFLSSFRPAHVLRNAVKGSSTNTLLRRILVIGQFALSIIVISGTLIMSGQLHYMRNKKLGFDKEKLVYLRSASYFSHKYSALKNNLLQIEGVENITVSNDLPTQVNMNTGATWEGQTEESKYVGFRTIITDEDYLDTYGMTMAKGRFYSREHPSDRQDAFVVNETAVQAMGVDDPIGTRFKAWGKEGRIIGVVKDFHFKSTKEFIEPMMIDLGSRHRFYGYMTIRLAGGNIEQTISALKSVWEQHLPDHIYEVHFLDQTIDSLYQSERKTRLIFSGFSFLAIAISCLGLFGLAMFASQQRVKEVGIRKVLGATVSGIAVLLSKSFTRWVIAANIIAVPVAWYAMHRWLQNFAYHIDLTVWPFVLSGLLALAIALMTVSVQAVRAARANPVESLRYE